MTAIQAIGWKFLDVNEEGDIVVDFKDSKRLAFQRATLPAFLAYHNSTARARRVLARARDPSAAFEQFDRSVQRAKEKYEAACTKVWGKICQH